MKIYRQSVGLLLSIAALPLFAGGHVAEGYDLETHRRIALRAVDVSELDQHLRTELGFTGGQGQLFLEREVRDWVALGARFEDVPWLRVVNHFHNPLQPWGQAGLLTGLSSVRWQQFGVQDWSWEDARQYYKEALTSAQPQQREAAFADTFRALGQLTHLIQDATVPAHVRNDSHLLFVNDDPYEEWVEGNPASVQSFLSSDPVVPPTSIFTPTGDTLAPVPIARLIDSDLFGGNSAPRPTDLTTGVAEYTNGNFLSGGTIFRDFALPRQSSLGAETFEPEMTSEGQKFRRYWRKKGFMELGGEGEAVEHFVSEGMLYETILAATGQPLIAGYRLIRRVHEDYAALLLPRAVGYSASLLNYFFRGTLNFTVSAGGPGGQSILKIKNTSSERMEGKFTLYADNSSDARSEVSGAFFDPLTLEPGGESSERNFTPPSDVKAYILVFEGKLGNPGPGSPVEEGAVVGKVQPASISISILSQVNGGSTGTSISFSPTVNPGDLVLAIVGVYTGAAGGRTWTNPSGWTTVSDDDGFSPIFAASGCDVHVAYRIAGSSESLPYIFSIDGAAAFMRGIVMTIGGYKASDPIDDSTTNYLDSDVGESVISPAATAGYVGSLRISWGILNDTSGTFGTPTGHTLLVHSPTSGVRVAAAYQLLSAAGAVGAVSWGTLTAGEGQFAGTILISSAPPAGATP